MKHLSLFILSYLFWLLLTWSVNPVSLLVGLVVAGLTTLLFGKHFYTSTFKFFQPWRYLMLVPFLAIFTWECIKANFDVAWRVVQYKIPIKPAIIKMPLMVKTDLARAVLSCALTMTPGTIVLDIEDDYMYVHWIYIDDKDPLTYALNKVNRFEKYIKIIFD